MYNHKKTGTTAGIAAGVFWATPFFVPIVLVDFSAFEIVFGRFVFFALISMFYLPRVIRLLKELDTKEFLQLFLLSAAGYWFYTFVLFLGIKLTNGIISPLILGCTPLTIILFSKPLLNLRLASGLLMILIGMGFILIMPLMKNGMEGNIHLSGIGLLFMAVALWTWFGINNSHFMHKHQHIKALDYSSAMGLISFLIVLPIFGSLYGFSSLAHHDNLSNYLIGSAVLGIGASWLANMLWVYCAKNCPSSILGALLTSETLFALIYSFIYNGRWPELHELVAMLSLIVGVFLVVASQKEY